MDRARIQGLAKVAILPISVHLGLLILFDLGRHLIATLMLVGVGFLGVYLAERQLRGRSWSRVVGAVMAGAVVLRFLLVPVPPTLSEDVQRYVWDGRVLTHGFNPYLLPPAAAELTDLRDARWQGLPHKEIATVYPPAAQLLFALVAGLPAPVLAWKILLVVLDLGTCYLLLRLARRWSLPPERVVWYAWNPLVTIELAAMGHVDGLGVSLVVLTTALLTAAPARIGGASLAAAGAIMAKLAPLLAMPIWARGSSRPFVFLALTGGLCVLALVPVVATAGGPPPGLVEYGISWEFNGPLFEPLWRWLQRLEWPSTVEAALDGLKERSGRHELWNQLYPFNYPQLWAKIALAAGLLVALVWSWRSREPATALGRAFGSMLIFSATVYPWYALWVLPWAALRRQAAWLAISGLLLLSYLPKFEGVPLFPWLQAAIWLPGLAILMVERWLSTR